MQTFDAYVRMSEAVDELGIDRQLAAIKKYVTTKGGKLGRVFSDNDISATKGKRRPGFEALLESGTSAIVVWHIDRLVRVSKDLERVIELNVNVYAVESGHVDLSNPAGRAVARTVTAWATYEGEQKAERQKLSNAQRARAGKPWWPRAPFGFEQDASQHRAEADALRFAYSAVLDGVSLVQVTRDLNDQGFVTNRGNAWTPTTLRPILLNPRNAGIRAYRGEEIGPAAWDGIVTEDVFRSVVRVLTDPTRSTGGGGQLQNLLTGIATCGVCQSGVKVAWRGRKGTPGAYKAYVCRGSQCVSHRQDWTDEFVAAYVITRVERKDIAPLVLVPDSGSDTEAVRAEAVRLRNRLVEIADDYDADRITRAQMLKMTESAREKLAVAEGELSRSNGESALAPMLKAKDPRRAWEHEMTLDQKRLAITALATSIELRQRGRGRRDMRPEDVYIRDGRRSR